MEQLNCEGPHSFRSPRLIPQLAQTEI